MLTNTHLTLARYTYDPLDRLTHCTPSDQPHIQRYYCQTRLSTEIQGTSHRSILQHEDQLLAQHHQDGAAASSALLATDLQRSVLRATHGNLRYAFAYAPYGYRTLTSGLLSLLGFNGESPDPVTGHYHLGNGYRQYNPVLMQFNSPDSWSPFGDGGLNAYAYCAGDPINNGDPTGRMLKHVLHRRILYTTFKIPRPKLVKEPTTKPFWFEDFHHLDAKTRRNTLVNSWTSLSENEVPGLPNAVKNNTAQRYNNPSEKIDWDTYKRQKTANTNQARFYHNKINAITYISTLREQKLKFSPSSQVREFEKHLSIDEYPWKQYSLNLNTNDIRSNIRKF
ncbi:RHS repeat-associated core domain-containing protein [Pseudomonas mandelii]|uniref:RHS repeat-associated core domain-containing protein n=1 Tax=Pseudomonas mandelii TaxID=75612 RepID=UPI00224B39EF|nr:RHS repeat-associated core domain-containing protein [Pseudomonas mandelii]MCX2897826.1 RHS repeat-associated core domain-containing protein [Pseudomonas mandelii]